MGYAKTSTSNTFHRKGRTVAPAAQKPASPKKAEMLKRIQANLQREGKAE
jgi:hypothetical protein